MKITTALLSAAAAGLWALAPAPSSAMPVHGIKQAAAQVDPVTEVRRRKRARVYVHGPVYRPYAGWIPPAHGFYDPSFRNRCIIDLGYGRWAPCDIKGR